MAMWCPTCEEQCQDHPSICTICGGPLQNRVAQTLYETGRSNAEAVVTRAIQNELTTVLQSFIATPGGGAGDGDVWEQPPMEAMDPINMQSRSLPTSKECIARLPRTKIDAKSSILHEAMVECGPSSFIATVGEFGTVPPYVVSGKVCLINDLKKEEGSGKIAFFSRGKGVTFASMAKTAQDAGAAAIIVENNVSVWPYIMKDSKNEAGGNIHIPAVMIKRSDGAALQTMMSRNNGSISCTIRARPKNEDEGCVVCREAFAIGDTVIRLPFCYHCFHQNCALFWLEKNNTCPFCRRELPTDDENYETERRRQNRTHAGGEIRLNQWETLFG